VVKVYEKGNMSKHLGEMCKGDTILCKGPIKKLPYEANMKKKIAMIAGAFIFFLRLHLVNLVHLFLTDEEPPLSLAQNVVTTLCALQVHMLCRCPCYPAPCNLEA
jgi:Oxidoreductase FAD-binding domain